MAIIEDNYAVKAKITTPKAKATPVKVTNDNLLVAQKAVTSIAPLEQVSETKKIKNTVTKVSGGGSGGGGGGGGGSGGGGGGGSGSASATVPTVVFTGTDDFVISPQAMYIYCKDRGETYMFDGVIKVNHTMTLKIEEEPDEKKASQYVNNAKNESNKVTFDIIMSDVYTDRNDLTKRAENRSESALTVLNALKRDRVLLDVITNLMTYKNMLLAGITLTQDDGTTHYGFYGQLVFQEKPEGGGGGTASSNTQSTKRVQSSTSSGRTPSIWAQWLGDGFI